jgi:ABC-type sugar transport system permease subunit
MAGGLARMQFTANTGLETLYNRRGLFHSLPISIGSFFRELFAVTLILILQERAFSYDFFTPGLVLFLIFMAFRVPYVNSYTLLFEALSLGQWDVKNHVGLRKYKDPSQDLLHVLVIFVAHICGALAAAAVRVYLDVTYGTEIMFGKERDSDMRTEVAPALQVNVDALRQFNSFWGAGDRINRLADSSLNGTVMQLLPLSSKNNLGISDTSFVVWYMSEEVGFVFLLCVCYIHIWLSAGVGENRKPLLNPFRRNYWKSLFRVCVLVVVIYIALYRAFPTAHGSLHTTIFKVQYQAWNPNVRLVDDDHNETFARIVGGFIGLFLAVGYNKMLVGTERSGPEDDPGGFYYKLVWGLEPDPNHTKALRVSDGLDDESDDEGSRRGKAHKWAGLRKGSTDDLGVGCKTYRIRHCEKGKCTDATCSVCVGSDFKLRLPRTLDHAK